jgi:hypothetical protein
MANHRRPFHDLFAVDEAHRATAGFREAASTARQHDWQVTLYDSAGVAARTFPLRLRPHCVLAVALSRRWIVAVMALALVRVVVRLSH